MCGLRSKDNFGGDIGIKVCVVYRDISFEPTKDLISNGLTIKANIIHSSATIVDLQWYLSRYLRLSGNLNNGLNTFHNLSLDHHL